MFDVLMFSWLTFTGSLPVTCTDTAKTRPVSVTKISGVRVDFGSGSDGNWYACIDDVCARIDTADLVEL